jgi:hypothetical protein
MKPVKAVHSRTIMIARPVTFASISEYKPHDIQMVAAEVDGQIVVRE